MNCDVGHPVALDVADRLAGNMQSLDLLAFVRKNRCRCYEVLLQRVGYRPFLKVVKDEDL